MHHWQLKIRSDEMVLSYEVRKLFGKAFCQRSSKTCIAFCRLRGRSLEWSCVGVIVTRIRTLRGWWFNSRSFGPFLTRILAWPNIGAIVFKSLFSWTMKYFSMMTRVPAASEFESEKTRPRLQLVQMSVYIQLHHNGPQGHCTVITPSITVWMTKKFLPTWRRFLHNVTLPRPQPLVSVQSGFCHHQTKVFPTVPDAKDGV